MSIETLLQAYNQLSDTEKVRFLHLIEPGEQDVSPEWLTEIKRRWQDFTDGNITAFDSDEADRRIIEEYGIQL